MTINPITGQLGGTFNPESNLPTVNNYTTGDALSLFSTSSSGGIDPKTGLIQPLTGPRISITDYMHFLQAFLLNLKRQLLVQGEVDTTISTNVLAAATEAIGGATGAYSAVVAKYYEDARAAFFNNIQVANDVRDQIPVIFNSINSYNGTSIALYNSFVDSVNATIDYINYGSPVPLITPLSHLPNLDQVPQIPLTFTFDDPNNQTLLNTARTTITNDNTILSVYNAMLTTVVPSTLTQVYAALDAHIGGPGPIPPNSAFFPPDVLLSPTLPPLTSQNFIPPPNYPVAVHPVLTSIASLIPIIQLLRSITTRPDKLKEPLVGLTTDDYKQQNKNIPQSNYTVSSSGSGSSSLLALAVGDSSDKLSVLLGQSVLNQILTDNNLAPPPDNTPTPPSNIEPIFTLTTLSFLNAATVIGLANGTSLLNANTGATTPSEQAITLGTAIGNLQGIQKVVNSGQIESSLTANLSTLKELNNLSAEDKAALIEQLTALIKLILLLLGLSQISAFGGNNVSLSSLLSTPSEQGTTTPSTSTPSTVSPPLLTTPSPAPLPSLTEPPSVTISPSLPPPTQVQQFIEQVVAQLPEDEKKTLKSALLKALTQLILPSPPSTEAPTPIVTSPNVDIGIAPSPPPLIVTPTETEQTRIEDIAFEKQTTQQMPSSLSMLNTEELSPKAPSNPTVSPPSVLQGVYDQVHILSSVPNSIQQEKVHDVMREFFTLPKDLKTLVLALLDPGKGFALWGWGPMYPDRHYPGEQAIRPI